jgi:hypothetical protein
MPPIPPIWDLQLAIPGEVIGTIPSIALIIDDLHVTFVQMESGE